MLKDKNKELKDNEQYALQLVSIIEDQKRVITSFKNKASQGEGNEVIYLKILLLKHLKNFLLNWTTFLPNLKINSIIILIQP